MRRTSTRLFSALILAGCTSGSSEPSTVEALLAGVACADEVQESLRRWSADADFLEGPPTASGARTVRLPTATFAEWVVLTLPVQDPPILMLVTPERTWTQTFAPDCSTGLRQRPHQPISHDTAGLFTDAHLAARVDAAEKAAIIYAWSPHMPLSTDGYAEIRRAGEAVGLPVVPVLMAFSDTRFAAREAARVGIPAEGLRQVASNELIQRQVQVHAPSIVVFSRDRVSPVLPGYRNADGYRRFIESFLQGSG